MTAFGQNLTRLLELNSHTRKELATTIGVNYKTVSGWCKGISVPPAYKLQMISDYFHVEISDLLKDQGTNTARKPYASVGSRILGLRNKWNLTQAELADKIGVNKQAISQYERGIRYPRPENLAALADYFRVTIDYISGKDSPGLVLDETEQAIVAAYRLLSDDQKRLVRSMLGIPEGRSDKK